ncbi:transposase [Acrocarpospora phusangensis]|uniref:Transposase n=1 Tax=Acrocarpospora phusangensis TaxID=1070424 RepID=A0A919UMZ7_9ACTN|nr:RNA-guided endonuclease TnpB family protein [Acrocarpospora phusangensis]GIH23823.1 transposase [Acrocarpospora phusangensis]
MLAGRRYRAEFTPEQAEFAEQIGGICRSVWNTALEQRRAYRRRGAFIGYAEQCRQLADAKADFGWLAEAPSHCLQQTLKDLDQACRTHGAWKVRWRSGHGWSPSFRFPDAKQILVERLARTWGRVKLPKLGWVRFRWSRPLGGMPRSATITRDGRHWYISFLVEDGTTTPRTHARPDCSVGVDRGVASAAVTSDGEFFDREFITAGEAERYRRLQRRLARAPKGSNRRRAVIAELGTVMRRVRHRRADFNAQTAHALTSRYGTIVLEDLSTRNMTASAKGTNQQPGAKVAQKRGLNRAILDKGWHGLELAARSAARHKGSALIKVPAMYTSQTCSACRMVDAVSRESQAWFACASCGHAEHADVNAAKNIKAAGLAVSGRGDLAVGRSVKRQPPRPRARRHAASAARGIPLL